MSEQAADTTGYEPDAPTRYAIQDKTGAIDGSRSHKYLDCPSVRSGTLLVEVSDREHTLLGLKPCSRCDKKAEGGPALKALTEYFGDEEAARSFLDALQARGFYIAAKGKRQTKTALKSTTPKNSA